MPVVEGLDPKPKNKKKKAPAPKPKPKVKPQAAVAPKAVPLSTGDSVVDGILARIQQMAGPVPTFDGPDIAADPGLPADYNAKAGDAVRKKFLAQPDGGGLGKPKGSDFHKILDILMRSGNSVRGAIYEGTRNDRDAQDITLGPLRVPRFGAIAEGAVRGFTAKEAYSGRKVLAGQGYTGRGAGTIGTAMELFLDPINAAPVGKIGAGLNRLDDTVLGAAKVVTPAAKKRAAGKAAQAAAPATTSAIAATSAIGDRSIPIAQSGSRPLVGTQKEILQEEARLAQRMGRINPKTASDETFGSDIMRTTLPTVTPKPVKIPVATPKTMPAPRPITIDDLSVAEKAEIADRATSKTIAWFQDSDLAAKVMPGLGRQSWETIKNNEALYSKVTKDPRFLAQFRKFTADEKNIALSTKNAVQEAEYVKSVQAIEEAAIKAAPEAAAQLDEITPQVLPNSKVVAPKELSDVHRGVIDAAVRLHVANHGEQALTALGQGQLRQTLANEYGKVVGSKLKFPSVQKKLRQMYIAAEEAVEASGIPLQAKGRLSEVWDNIPKGDLSDPGKIAARLDADDVVAAAQSVAKDLPAGVQKSFVNSVLKSLQQSGNAADVATAKYMGTPELKYRVATAVAEDLGATLPTKQFEKVLKSKKEYESMFAVLGNVGELIDKSFRTAYQKTPWEQSATRMGQGQVNTAIEGDINYLRTLVKGTDQPGFQAAFETAQRGGTEPMAAKVSEYMNHVTKTAERAGVTPHEFIQQLKRVPDFKDIDPALGFDAWKSPGIVGEKHAAKLMALYANAAHNSTLNAIIAGHLGPLFGAVRTTTTSVGKAHSDAVQQLAKKEGYVRVDGIPALDGVLFPKEFAPRIKELLDMASPAGMKKTNEFLKFYDKGLSLYKVGLTKYLPSHHITNHIGGMYMAFLDGMVDPRWLARSWSVMKHQDAAVDGVSKGMTSEGLKRADGSVIPQADIMRLFNESGLRPSFAGISDLASDAAELRLKSSIPTAVDKASQAREVHMRLSHFMYALSVEKGSLDDAVRAATMRVQKHHGDYGDLTDFERRVMRRVIPFYTWQRKVAPTLIRQAASHPGKIMAYPKLQQSINEHFGIEPEPGNPFPGGELTPSFMTEGIQAKYGTNAAGNEIWGAPRTPFDDVVGKAINHPVGNILEQLGPAIKVPYELRSGTAIGNSDIRVLTDTKDKRDYIEQNTPLLSLLVRLTRFSPLHAITGDTENMRTQTGEDEQGTNIPALINLLTGANLRENTERMRGIAERERQG